MAVELVKIIPKDKILLSSISDTDITLISNYITKYYKLSKSKNTIYKNMLQHPEWSKISEEDKEYLYEEMIELLEKKKIQDKETKGYAKEMKEFDKEERKHKRELKKIAKEDKEEADRHKRWMSGYVDEEKKIILEQVWDKEKGSRFCIYNDNTKEISYAKQYQDGELTYLPQEGEEIELKSVILPSKAEEYTDDITLDKDILSFINKWLDIPKNIQQLGLWNTKKSYVFDKFSSVNYLRVRGDLGMGKSRFLDTFGGISYKPLFTTGSVTPAPLFRMITKWKGTLVMDEADINKSDATNEIIKVLNQGFEKERYIWRCDQNDASKILTFDPYCPKIIATRLGFIDKATESRCLTHIAAGTTRTDIPINRDESFYNGSEHIRNQLLMWRFKNYFNINIKAKIDLGKLEPRIKQLVNGFGCIFNDNEEEMYIFRKWIAEYQQELIEERQDSLSGEILMALHELMKGGSLYISNQDVVVKGDIVDFNNNPMGPKKLTSTLKSLGLGKNHLMKYDNKSKRCIPLDLDILNPLFLRYGLDVIKKEKVLNNKEIQKEKDLNNKENGYDRHDRHDTMVETEKEEKNGKIAPKQLNKLLFEEK